MSGIKPKVTGIGGIFFKTSDVEKTKEWYGKNLGLYHLLIYFSPKLVV